MAKTLLDGVNYVLKRANVIGGDAGVLTTLVDSGRQHAIDIALQVINEGVDELYSLAGQAKPNQQGESSIALVAGTREYALASGLVSLHYPMIDKTNTQFLEEFPGGYDALLLWDPEQNNTGLPQWGVISPVTGLFHIDTAPTSVEAGRVYTYQFEKDMVVSAATDTFPFTDIVFRSMVPAWKQLYSRDMRNEFDTALYQQAVGRASRYLSEREPRTSYSPR